MKKRVLAIGLMLAMTFSLLTACGSSDGDAGGESTEAAERVLNIAISEMPEVIDPISNTDNNMRIADAFYDCLYVVGTGGEITYFLAESCEPAEDSMSFTLKLRDDATWSDGTNITSEDVLFTVDYYQTYVTAGAPASLLSGYSVKAIDEKTVEFTLDEYVATFLSDLGKLRLHPAHVFEGDIDKVEGSEYMSSTKIVTSSAFKLVEWNTGASFVFDVRDDYYGEGPDYDKLNLIYIPETNAAQLAFENGEISYIDLISADDIEKYSEDYNVYSYMGAKVWHLQYNPDGQSGAGLSDEEREAVSLVLDGQEIVDSVFGSEMLAEPADSFFSVAEEFHNDDLKRVPDVETAKTLAESSGLTGKTLTIIYNTGTKAAESTGIVIQQQLAKIGVTANLQGYDASAFYPRTFHKTFGTDPAAAESSDWDFAIGFESSMYGEAHNSHAGYAEMQVFGDKTAELVIQASKTVDSAERERLYKEAQVSNAEDNYWIPLFEENVVIAAQKNVTGFDQFDIDPRLYGYSLYGVE